MSTVPHGSRVNQDASLVRGHQSIPSCVFAQYRPTTVNILCRSEFQPKECILGSAAPLVGVFSKRWLFGHAWKWLTLFPTLDDQWVEYLQLTSKYGVHFPERDFWPFSFHEVWGSLMCSILYVQRFSKLVLERHSMFPPPPQWAAWN